MNIITMEEFLKRKALTGNLKDMKTGIVLNPPNNKTNWDGERLNPLWSYLREVGLFPEDWDPWECFAAIPASKDPSAVVELQNMFDDIMGGKHGFIPDPTKDFRDAPIPVDSNTVERMREMMAGRKKICIYDKNLQETELLHFKVEGKKGRMLTHFYAFIFFQDWVSNKCVNVLRGIDFLLCVFFSLILSQFPKRQDLWSKRFVRDHVRYIDEIVCAAARVVKAVRERARKHLDSNTGGEYDSMHIRRGDFQFKNVKLSAVALQKESKDYVKEGGTLYIATDERQKDFFGVFKEHYDVTFLDDYMDVLKGVNPNYYGTCGYPFFIRLQHFNTHFLFRHAGPIGCIQGASFCWHMVLDAFRLRKSDARLFFSQK